MAGGKFEKRSHDELYNMVATAKPDQLTSVGAALMAAFDDINAIADELKAHAERVHWEGEGADAFREWGREVAKQTHKMADYTLLVGLHMSTAGQGLSEVKAAMPAPTAADDKKHKSDAEQAVADKHHLEALRQMDKLDSYYETAYTEINGLEEPNFPPLPPGFGNFEGGAAPSGASPSSVSAGDRQSAVHASPPAALPNLAGGAHLASHPAVNGSDDVGAHPAVVPDTNTTIDSTKFRTPDVIDPSRLPASPPQDVPEQRVNPVVPNSPRPHLPSTPPTERLGGKSVREPYNRYQGSVKQPRPMTPPRTGLPDGVHGGKQARPPGEASAPRIPRGRVVGEEQGLMKRGPVGPATHGFGDTSRTGNSGPGRRLASERGGAVDSPRGSNNVNGQRLPRGTVVGEEHGIPPRHGSLGASGASPEGNTRTPAGSGGQGRRLASEPGGAVGSTRSGRGSQSEFTPGGSGLIRGNQVPEPMPRSGRGASNSSEVASSRPDYLQEDEETWAGGRRDTVPPVID
ncbi:WXG100 family type VII secretion target [Streptomyces hygroscopicus]|uniref:WXG100 family type VII secretion target n=1 Tax=Streptomyces hygroscopicus TaxID=1912 RepID=UPI0036CEEA7B